MTEPRIRILPPELAEQIAAGEVVERPASVVKELVENALDAGARRIEVSLEAGGRRLIRVVDDGCGMSPEEARLAIRRHATSKLRSADDLWTLATFGFRGEALPSIASVSRLSLGTCPVGASAGFRLTLEGGREIEAGPAGTPEGTQIDVRDLFFNTPARLKFLKTEATETANVSEALLRLGLANPGVHVRLRSNDRTVLDLPPVSAFAERVRTALGRRGAGALHEALGEENEVVVRAYLAPPEEATSTPRNTFLFVGRRSVRDRSLLAALVMGYGELLEKGRYPLAALFVDVPGAELDVNVHPQKLEVRFARAQEVYAAVRHVVGAGLARAPWLTSRPPRPAGPAGLDELEGGDRPAAHSPPWQMAEAAGRAAAGLSREAAARGSSAGSWSPSSWSRPTSLPDSSPDPSPSWSAAMPLPGVRAAEGGAGERAAFFSGLRYVGQVHRTYLVCEAAGEVVLVDQHAAHERLAFSRLRQSHQARAVARQHLLFPIEIDLDPREQAVAASPEVVNALQALGFEWDLPEAGERLALRTVPELLRGGDPATLVRDALGALGEDPATLAIEERFDHLLATLACHSVKRAGDAISEAEVQALLNALDGVDLRGHCPHGRPVLVRLTLTEIERRFGRA